MLVYLVIFLAVLFIFGLMLSFAYPGMMARGLVGLFRISTKGTKAVIKLGATGLTHPDSLAADYHRYLFLL